MALLAAASRPFLQTLPIISVVQANDRKLATEGRHSTPSCWTASFASFRASKAAEGSTLPRALREASERPSGNAKRLEGYLALKKMPTPL